MRDSSHLSDPNMKSPGFASHFILLFLFATILSANSEADPESFIKCMQFTVSSTQILFSSNSTSYLPVLEFSVQNLLFNISTTPKPAFIITPLQESHIRDAIICSKNWGFLVRVRSGGHDYEGLSYTAPKPFVIIDLVKFQEITVDIKANTAWVQAGATNGQVYYHIAKKSNTRAFPAGVCTTLGLGGHIGGGGIGFLMRKYGLSADNVLDAKLVDAYGDILDRKSMGEDMFWAIRGGGASSFGVVVAWKIKLVRVPTTVTIFNVALTLEQGATSVFFKWQTIAPKFPKDIQVRAIVLPVDGEKGKTIQIIFQSLYLGTVKEVVPLMREKFPELGLETKHCKEMSWINSTLEVAGLGGQPYEALLNRSQPGAKRFFKGKSDFMTEAISISRLEDIWKIMTEKDVSPLLILEPLGGKMKEISESATPFPHRAGMLYNIQYFLAWEDASKSAEYLESMRNLYNNMTPSVPMLPRASYLNYRDLDLGVNRDINTTYAEARDWGEKYFKNNFAKLAFVKTMVDPNNFFWDEQSIPLFCSKC